MQPINSTPFRDSYRFPVRAHETGQYAYIDVNGNDRFDSGVDPQITAANENSAVALSVPTLAKAAAQGPITHLDHYGKDMRLSLSQPPAGVSAPLAELSVAADETGLTATATFQKKANLVTEDGSYRLDRDGDGKGDSSLMVELWDVPAERVQQEVGGLMRHIEDEMFFRNKSGPYVEAGPGPNEPKIYESPNPFPMTSPGDVTRTFTYVDGSPIPGGSTRGVFPPLPCDPVGPEGGRMQPVVLYSFQPWPEHAIGG